MQKQIKMNEHFMPKFYWSKTGLNFRGGQHRKIVGTCRERDGQPITRSPVRTPPPVTRSASGHFRADRKRATFQGPWGCYYLNTASRHGGLVHSDPLESTKSSESQLPHQLAESFFSKINTRFKTCNSSPSLMSISYPPHEIFIKYTEIVNEG